MTTQNRNRGQRSSTSAPSTTRSTADESPSSAMNRRETEPNYPARRDQWSGSSAMSSWRAWTDQMERLFNSFGLGAAGNRIGDWSMWNPQVETFQRGDQLVIRVDLPGMEKDDVSVEVTDDQVIVQGERRNDFEEERGGVYRSERSYGTFYRAIPLPLGAISDNVTANFKNGVLEITMPAPPPEASRGRRIEIGEGGKTT